MRAASINKQTIISELDVVLPAHANAAIWTHRHCKHLIRLDTVPITKQPRAGQHELGATDLCQGENQGWSERLKHVPVVLREVLDDFFAGGGQP